MTEYTFSVFTPSYNRAKTLPRLYEALKRQTYRNFEWIIVINAKIILFIVFSIIPLSIIILQI